MLRKFLLIIILTGYTAIYAQEAVLTGVFQGHSLYVKNPYILEQDSFCIESISVNKRDVDIDNKLTAIKLNFDGVDLYSPVMVKVYHKDSCRPKFVNPEAILFHSSFKYDSLYITDSLMYWHTKGDKREGIYTIEKLAGFEWIEESTIKAKGEFEGADYIYFPLFEDGGNKYRIKYSLPSGRFLYSNELEVFHYPEPITFKPKSVTDKITLSQFADYRILDLEGNVIVSGSGRVIPLRRLKKGDYMLYLEGQTQSAAATYPFVKK